MTVWTYSLDVFQCACPHWTVPFSWLICQTWPSWAQLSAAFTLSSILLVSCKKLTTTKLCSQINDCTSHSAITTELVSDMIDFWVILQLKCHHFSLKYHNFSSIHSVDSPRNMKTKQKTNQATNQKNPQATTRKKQPKKPKKGSAGHQEAVLAGCVTP